MLGEARDRMNLAERIILSNSDLVEEIRVERLSEQLRVLNPRADIEIAIDGAIDPRCLIEPRENVDHAFVAEADHSDGIASFVLNVDRPISWNVFARTMETLIALR